MIIGITKLNLDPKNEAYLLECLAANPARTFFCSRRGSNGRVIQGSSENVEGALRTFAGWSGSRINYAPSVFEIRDNRVIWHTPKK